MAFRAQSTFNSTDDQPTYQGRKTQHVDGGAADDSASQQRVTTTAAFQVRPLIYTIGRTIGGAGEPRLMSLQDDHHEYSGPAGSAFTTDPLTSPS
jgi:hypothetical protein